MSDTNGSGVVATVFLSGKIAIPKDSPLKFSRPEEKWTDEEICEHLRANLSYRIQTGSWSSEEDDEGDE